MKFKDLKIGDKFTMSQWSPGVVSRKIKPKKVFSPRGDCAYFMATEMEISPPTGITSGHVKPDDEVIKVD
jgi:hypothetical protein